MSDLRKQISAAARELYLREGLDGFSMRKLADMVGVSAPAIYRHYQNKNDLMNEIIVEGLKILESYLEPALEAKTAFERLNRLIDSYLDFALEQPKYFDFAFLTPSRNIDRFPDELSKHDWTTFAVAVDQVSQCMNQGIFRKDDPLETAITIWAEAHGLVTLYRMQRFGDQEELFRQIYRGAVDRVIGGLKK